MEGVYYLPDYRIEPSDLDGGMFLGRSSGIDTGF